MCFTLQDAGIISASCNTKSMLSLKWCTRTQVSALCAVQNESQACDGQLFVFGQRNHILLTHKVHTAHFWQGIDQYYRWKDSCCSQPNHLIFLCFYNRTGLVAAAHCKLFLREIGSWRACFEIQLKAGGAYSLFFFLFKGFNNKWRWHLTVSFFRVHSVLQRDESIILSW